MMAEFELRWAVKMGKIGLGKQRKLKLEINSSLYRKVFRQWIFNNIFIF